MVALIATSAVRPRRRGPWPTTLPEMLRSVRRIGGVSDIGSAAQSPAPAAQKGTVLSTSVAVVPGRSELGPAAASRRQRWQLLDFEARIRFTTRPRSKRSWPCRGAKPCGRVAAIINHAHNQRAKEHRGFFGSFGVRRPAGRCRVVRRRMRGWPSGAWTIRRPGQSVVELRVADCSSSRRVR